MKTHVITQSEDHISQEAIENSSTRLVPAGAVLLVTRSGILEHTLPVALAGLPVTLNQDLKALVPHAGIDSNYAAFALRSHAWRILQSCSKAGTTVASIDFDRLKEFELPLPPTNEQRRIVSKLESLQARSRRAKEALNAIPALLERFRQSVLAAAFQGDLTADWRAQHPDIEPASQLLERIRAERRHRWEEAELEKMRAKGKGPKDDSWKAQYNDPSTVECDTNAPAGWCYAALNELRAVEPNSMTDGPFGSNLKTSDYVPSGVRVIRLGNLGVGELDLTDEAFISSEKFNELRKHEIFAGDLVIAALAEPLARCCQIPASLGPAIVKADCIRFKPHSAISARLLMHYLNSPPGRSSAESLGHGIGRLRINMENLRQLPVPILPTEEQQLLLSRIEALLRRIGTLESTYNSTQAQLESLDGAVLAKAFRGELVPQDPNDEPASVLLERIRAERETSDGSTPKRSRGRRPAA
jgi:type I restriction enzyme S subunit